jgi:hypothetical protein
MYLHINIKAGERATYMYTYYVYIIWPRVSTHIESSNAAPAGGASAAAPEGGALAGPSASPHLPVVGAGNPVAVPGLAR